MCGNKVSLWLQACLVRFTLLLARNQLLLTPVGISTLPKNSSRTSLLVGKVAKVFFHDRSCQSPLWGRQSPHQLWCSCSYLIFIESVRLLWLSGWWACTRHPSSTGGGVHLPPWPPAQVFSQTGSTDIPGAEQQLDEYYSTKCNICGFCTDMTIVAKHLILHA